ncbi:MAG: MBG domain-containing protein, partial [Kiritimatiellae bacterium]|nr:MBG domain-containing protein [Kiritimatiellia bacterium]
NGLGLSATADSGLPVSFEVESGPAVLDGGTNLSFSGAGAVAVVGSQAGNLTYEAASVTQTFQVVKAVASLTLTNLSHTYDGTPKAATVLSVPSVSSVVNYNSSTNAPSAVGSYTCVASVVDAMYQGGVTGLFEILAPVVWTVEVVSAHGMCVPGAGSYVWTNGDTFATAITNPLLQNISTQYVYTIWTGTGSAAGSGSGTNVDFAVTQNSRLTWNWGTNFLLSASTSAYGSLDVTQAWVNAGSSTQITAVADEYYAFTNWSGGAPGSVNPVSLLMDGAKSVSAEFAALVATSNVPQWWLGQYGFTNDFDAACAADQDGDGDLTWQEWVCGTVPTNGASRFVFGVESGNGSMVFSWDPAVSGRVYAVEDTQELLNGFTNVAVVLSNRVNCWTGSTDVGNAFYRVRVEE